MAEKVFIHRKYLVVLGAALLLIVFAAQLFTSVAQQSISWDEDDHIFAGYMSWKQADFGLNPEHPPLLKLVATVPILKMPLNVPAMQNRNFKHEAFLGGKDFLFKNDANAMLLRTRMAAGLFAIALLIVVFVASREMFGLGAAFIALTLLAFDPNLLGFGAMVATDTALSCTMFATVYALYRYVKQPAAGRLMVAGLAAGLALATKHSAILLLPISVLLVMSELGRRDHAETAPRKTSRTWAGIGRLSLAVVAMSAVAIAMLWASYGFRYAARPAGMQLNPPFAEYIHLLSRPREVSVISFFAHWHLLPESYLYGLIDVRFMSDFYQTYLLGKPYPHGVWFYFPVVMLIKTTIGLMGLLLLTLGALASRKLAASREVVFLTIPPVVYLLVAMWSGMNIGLRHILPMYPFLTVLAAGAAWALIQQRKQWAYVVALLVFMQIASSLKTYPDYIPYANEFWGGPAQTYKLLSDSNSDWGQQLEATSRYLSEHRIKDCWFLYFAQGVVDTNYYGIPCKPLPTVNTFWLNQTYDVPASIDGTVLVSAANLSGYEFGPGAKLNPYQIFIGREPKTVIGHAVFVYDGHFEIPLAAALVHSQKAASLLGANKTEEALAEAREAVRLAPDSVTPQAALADALMAANQKDEARVHYQTALNLAKSVEPEFQIGWVATLEQKLRQI